jgi:hypothetical protein
MRRLAALVVGASLACCQGCARTVLAPEPLDLAAPGEGGGAAARGGEGAGGVAGVREADAGADVSAGAGGTAGTAGAPTTAGVGEARPVSGDEETWVGELWSITPLLCDPEAQWSDTPVVVQDTGHREPVVLVLAPGEAGAPRGGVIAFGEGELRLTDRPDPSEAGTDSGSFHLCSIQIPSKGAAYTVLDARRTERRLSFAIVAAEVWQPGCNGVFETCIPCTRHCDLVGARLPFDMVIDGDFMQGTVLAAAFGTSSELHLRRLR